MRDVRVASRRVASRVVAMARANPSAMTRVDAAPSASASARASSATRRHALMFAWLGLIHVDVAVTALAVWTLPSAMAVTALATLVAAAAIPRTVATPRWGARLARAVTRTATAYFPTRLEFEDEEAYLRAVRNEEACVIGLEPHGVLPLSVISFAEYFMHDEEGARRRGLTPAARRGARALASAAIFKVPLVKHLWTWLGLDPISKACMLRMLRAGKTAVIIPGGVAECMAMERGVETLYLRKRYGFVKIAIVTGAKLIPAYTFGQSRTYGYWRLGPPIVPKFVADWIGKTFSFAPIIFWGKFCTPIPYATALNTVVGKPIEVEKNPDPSKEEVQAKLDEFIDAMRSLYDSHKARFGYEDVRLVIC